MDRQTPPTSRLSDVLDAITDQAPVPWSTLEREFNSEAELEGLRLIDDIARAFRGRASEPTADAAPAALFEWNGLRVIERIGGGSYGEVYRAFDPWLERDVALKLFARDASAGLDEARRLARIRHHHVLAVFGCGIDRDRAGLWSELIAGATLADLVARDGAFSSEETLRIGRDLARALITVHAAGLVHGDIKAENVMRERGGRIVLMDFGAGGQERLLAGNRMLSATLRYLPPEVLDGAPLSQQSDLFALAVLLYFLRCGALPWSATDPLLLRAAQRQGVRVPAAEQASAGDARLSTLIEQGLAFDASKRPRNAVEFAALLGQAAGGPEAVAIAMPRARAYRGFWIAGAAAACAAAVAGLWAVFAPPPWTSDAAFLRVGTSGDEPLGPSASVRVGDRLRLHFSSNRDAYVYVLNEDADGQATVLFPLPGMDNPVRADAALDLPGGAGSTLAWEVSDGADHEEFLVFASPEPLQELESAVERWRQAQPTQRSVGSVVDTVPPEISGTHLRAALKAAEDGGGDTPWRRWHFDFRHAQ